MDVLGHSVTASEIETGGNQRMFVAICECGQWSSGGHTSEGEALALHYNHAHAAQAEREGFGEND